MGSIRLLPGLAALLALALIAFSLPAQPAYARPCVTPPSITIAPERGTPGLTVTVTGENCGDRQWVDIYYVGTWVDHVLTTGAGSFTITVTIPDSPTGRQRLRTESEAGEALAIFTVQPGLTVNPGRGPESTPVTVTGRGFAANERIIDVRYYLNGGYLTVAESIPVDADGTWEASLQIPASARGEHKIDAWGTRTQRAAVRPAIFEITPGIGMEATSGNAGQSVTVRGKGFVAGEKDIRILFDGQPVRTGIPADSQGYWQASFDVPEKPKGTYYVTAEGESTWRRDVAELSFTVGPGIALSPPEGHAGMALTVTGRGFAPGKDVAITYEGSHVKTEMTNEDGSFSVSFTVPESPSGPRKVTARTATDPNGVSEVGPNAAAFFSMESEPPPVPAPISPPARARVGFIYKGTPTFEWAEVEDPSGVYYSLQIATSDQMMPDAGFANPMISEEGLTGTGYALEADHLPYGRYYWIVQAVDGAQNESGWSEVYYFRVGLLPRWGFIAAAVALGIIFLALIRMAIIRRTYYY